MSDDLADYADALARARRLAPAAQRRLIAELGAGMSAPAPAQAAPGPAPAAPAPADVEEAGPLELLSGPGGRLLIPNGISVATGRPVVTLDEATAQRLALGERGPQAQEQLYKNRVIFSQTGSFGMVYGKSYADLVDAGWALVVSAEEPAALIEALLPLVRHRSEQQQIDLPPLSFMPGETCGAWLERHAPADPAIRSPWHPRRAARVPVLVYLPGQSAQDFLASYNVTNGPVDPARGVPFYLMLAGRPGPLAEGDRTPIPYGVQYDLDIFYGVGRLCFSAAEGQHDYAAYAAYAEQVRAFEGRATPPYERRIAFFATDADESTAESRDGLVIPLARGDARLGIAGSAQARGFTPHEIIGAGATRAALNELLRGDGPAGKPALLFTATHGAQIPNYTSREMPGQQGALICQDWPGSGPARPEHWLDAEGLDPRADVAGLVAVFFACFGLGCPQYDTYAAGAGRRRRIAPRDLVSALPQRLLARGALAAIGHIDVAWSYGFSLPELGVSGQTQGFDSLLQALMDGGRVGFATDQLNLRQAAFASALSEAARDAAAGVAAGDITATWRGYHDARSYVVLGDPAVRLPFAPA